ncbi:MAG: type II secretion system F family protein [Tepidisphaeraceae bacterium]|jgi:type II secretory pathway component PulF
MAENRPTHRILNILAIIVLAVGEVLCLFVVVAALVADLPEMAFLVSLVALALLFGMATMLLHLSEDFGLIDNLDRQTVWTILKGATRLILIALVCFLILVLIVLLAQGVVTDPDDVGPIAILLMILGILLIVPIQVMNMLHRRRRQIILEYLDQAVRLNLPLPRMMTAAAFSEEGAIRLKLMDLAGALDGGQSVHDSLRPVMPEVETTLIPQLAAAENIGRLDHALSRAARSARPASSEEREGAIFYGDYFLIYLTLLLCVAQVIWAKVVPRFSSIMADFHITPPTSLTLAVTLLMPILMIGSAVVVASGLLFWLIHPLWPIFRRREIFRQLARALQEVVVKIPLLGGFVRDRALAESLDFLADAMDARLPFDAALYQAAEAQRDGFLSRRLRQWASRITQGTPLPQAAKEAGMPALLVGLLPAAAGSDALAATLSFLAKHYETRLATTRALLRSFYIPILILVMASAVAMLGMAIFQSTTLCAMAASHYKSGF